MSDNKAPILDKKELRTGVRAKIQKFLPKIKTPHLVMPKIGKLNSKLLGSDSRAKIKWFPKKKQSKDWFVPALIFSVFLAAIMGFLTGALVVHYFISNQGTLPDLGLFESILDKDGSSGQGAGINGSEIVSQEEAVIRTVKKASPSVVSIIVSKDLPIIEKYYYNPFEEFEEFFDEGLDFEVPGYRQKGTERKEIGGGTGFIVSSEGLILTNKHVVAEEDADYTVLTNNGKSFEAIVLARDPVQDIAILKIETEQPLPVVELGDSDELQIGQTVIAIGNVLGEFRNSVSVGIVSGLRRNIVASGGGVSEALEDIIQTDAAINRGNSGGPLLNLRGEVIGMNTAMAIDAENVGFAVPINKAKRDIQQVKDTGEIVYPFLGIYYTIITPALQKEFDLSVAYGAWIGRDSSGQETEIAIFPGSVAEETGLQRDDIILEMGGEKIDIENSLANLIMEYAPGDRVILRVLRGGQEKIFSVVLDRHKG